MHEGDVSHLPKLGAEVYHNRLWHERRRFVNISPDSVESERRHRPTEGHGLSSVYARIGHTLGFKFRIIGHCDGG